jgi:1-phosphofructokinase
MKQGLLPHVTCVLINPTIDHVHEVDHFVAGGTYKSRVTSVFPVGKAISVALGLHVLGDDPSVIALVGRDEVNVYQAFLASNEIRATLVPVEGRTRRNMTIVDAVEGTITHVRESGFTAGEKHVQAIETELSRLRGDGDRGEHWIIISGSIPPGLDTNTYGRIIASCTERGFKVLLDASGEALKAAMDTRKPWVLKINRVELEYLAGQRNDDTEHGGGNCKDGDEQSPAQPSRPQLARIVASARGLLGQGLEHVAVTLGAAGAIHATASEAWHGHVTWPREKRVVNTVGAGDAYFAGMIHAMMRGKSVHDIMVDAISCASAKVLVHGAGAFSREEQRTFSSRVMVDRIP